MKSPETGGKDQWTLQGTLGSGHDVELASATFDPIFGSGTSIDTGLRYTNGLDIYVGGGAGVLENLDLFVDAALDSPLNFGVQWQIFGDSAAIRSRGIKLSALAAFGYHTENDRSSDFTSCSGSNCTTSEKIDGDHRTYQTSVGLAVGYRFDHFSMLYLAPLYLQEYSSGSVVRATNLQAFSFGNRSKQFSLNIGGELNFGGEGNPKATFLRTEYSFSRISSESNYGKTHRGLSLSLGFRI